MKYIPTFVASCWCFHLLVYDPRNHETEKNVCLCWGKCLQIKIVVYPPTVEEYVVHAREVLGRLQRAGFILNPFVTLDATEMKYLDHILPSRGIKTQRDRIANIQHYPRPTNMRTLKSIICMMGFYSQSIPDYFRKAESFTA